MAPASDALLAMSLALCLLAGCGEDQVPVGPEPSEPKFTVVSNGGGMPEVITTRQGETESLLFTFGVPPGCLVPSDFVLRCLIDGSSYGVDCGDWTYPGQDDVQGNVAILAEQSGGYFNLPSPPNVGKARDNGVYQSPSSDTMKMIPIKVLVQRISVVASALLVCPVHAVAQYGEVGGWTAETLPDVETILRDLECEAQVPPREGPASCVGFDPIVWIQSHPDEVPHSKILSLLDGLERMALSNDVPVVRRTAVSTMATFTGDPAYQILPRLLRIYEGTDDPAVRSLVSTYVAKHIDQPAAAALLMRIAQQDASNEDFPGASEKTIRSLGIAGPAGAAVLRDLHIQDLVKDPEARMLLEVSAKQAYQLRSTAD